MSKITYKELAYMILEQSKSPLSVGEIFKIAVEQGLDKRLSSIGKTPEHSLAAFIYTDIKNNGEKALFMRVGKRPTTFWLKSRQNELLILKDKPVEEEFKSKINQSKFNERDLHPVLVKFLYESEFDLYAKTIYHEKSSKNEKGKDRWNYPDIVGIHFPFEDFEEQTLSLLANLSKPSYKLYSFELKKAISWADLKEYYFQAVSNSSWANEGYLVVFEDINEEILNELVRLNASFGIGVIQLESNINSSKVLLRAKERELDIQTLDMLINKNKNFKDFIADINKDIKVNDKFRIAKDRYDKVLNEEEFEKYLKDKEIQKDE